MRSQKTALELASDMGAKAFDLCRYSNSEVDAALRLLTEVNPELFSWLRERLTATSPAAPSSDQKAEAPR